MKSLKSFLENNPNKSRPEIVDVYWEDYSAKTFDRPEFKKLLEEKGGFFSAHWDGTPETEAAIKEETKATIRCIPLDRKEEKGTCMYSGKPSAGRVLFARAY